MIGFRVGPGRIPALFEKTGLKQGDIVLSVNGTPLTSASKGMTAMQSLLSGSSATLGITRRGSNMNITVNF